MAYEKTNWQDTLRDAQGNVIQKGTPLNAQALGKIEEGIVQTEQKIDTEIGKVTTQLAENVLKVDGVVNTSEFLRAENETNDYFRIERALTSLVKNEKLTLGGGELLIDKPIKINSKNIGLLSNGITTIKAIAPMEACIILESKNSESIVAMIDFLNILIDCNNQSNYGILVKDSVGLYASDLHFSNVEVKKAILDGICLIAPVWQVTLNKITSTFNGRDGIRAIMNGSKQVNTIKISESFCSSNKGNGITLNGTRHTIEKCTLERNNYGISFDASLNFVEGNQSWVIKNTVENNYMELNKLGQIHIKTKSGGSNISKLSILENYMLASGDSGHTGKSLIQCEGNGVIELTTKGNSYAKQGNVVNDIDGAGILDYSTNIEDTTNVVNANLASLKTQHNKKIPIPTGLIQGVNYDFSTQKSENIIPLTNKMMGFGLPFEISHKLIRLMSLFVETDSTDYTIRLHYKVKNLETGVITKQGYIDSSKTSSSKVEVNLINAWGFGRRADSEYMYFEVRLFSNSNGTYLHFHVPFVEMTR